MMTQTIAANDDELQTAVDAAVALLRQGEVVALPTETVYGLAANAFDSTAVMKIFEAKERPAFDPLIVHIGAQKDLEQVAIIPEKTRPYLNELIKAFWPGPLTIILPKSDQIPDIVTSGLPHVAVRQSIHPIIRAVIKQLKCPLAAPSANRFGRISPTSASAVSKELDGKIPLIIDGGACSEGLESTIISIEPRENKKPIFHLHRSGPITKEQLQVYGKVEKVKPILDNHPQAPGQLASHYAPKTPLKLISTIEEFIPEPGKTYGLLSYTGNPNDGFVSAYPWDHIESLSPGNGKLAEAAIRFFYALRALDEAGVDEIIAEPISETGLGAAIMDRLRRANKA